MRLIGILGAGLVLVAPPVLAQNTVTWQGVRPTLSLANGDFTLSPVGRLDLDGGSYFGQDEPGGFSSGVNVRRARIGVQGTVLRDFYYNFTWDFAPQTPQYQSLGGKVFEAQLAYTGLRWATIRVGAFTPLHTLEFSGSSFELLFMERAAITNIVTSLGSGDTRVAAGIEAHGERWLAGAYLTDGVLSTLNDNQQRGAAGRAAFLALNEELVQLQIGLGATYQWRPGPNTSESVRLRDYPELRVDAERLLDTGSIRADSAWTLGPEVAGRIGPVYVAAEYYHVGVDVAGGGTRGFDGWYAQAAYPLLGEPRQREAARGVWRAPRAPDFDPASGNWGALELAGRYSTANLNDGPVRGGRQSIWSAALNWYPTRQMHFTVQYQNGTVDRDRGDRPFQAVGFRLSFNL